ncbi:MAG: hypothetical protein LBN02_07790 [Oscillospiraceae bacterium]|jgi:uncharacterized protein|nr:hypothetical protein [Oscillospiraceae bacterium]
MNLQSISRIFADEMAHLRTDWNEPGAKYYHGQRVAKLAVRLRELLFPQLLDKDDILTVAAWFHDVYNGHELYHETHGVSGAERTRELISAYCAPDELDDICGIIAIHDDRTAPNCSELAKLHQDADLLDHFGTHTMWRLAIYSPPHERTILDAAEFLRHDLDLNGERWRGRLNFELSRKIFDEKADFVRHYSERFDAELDGRIWDEERLIGEL